MVVKGSTTHIIISFQLLVGLGKKVCTTVIRISSTILLCPDTHYRFSVRELVRQRVTILRKFESYDSNEDREIHSIGRSYIDDSYATQR